MSLFTKQVTERSKEIKAGLFSKQEGAEAVIQGTRHIHSSLLGKSDPCWKTTHSLLSGTEQRYPWEIADESEALIFTDSNKRIESLGGLVSSTRFCQKSQNKERVNLIMEELLSNAFYHAYKNELKEDKYDRLKAVSLKRGEEIRIFAGENSQGINLVVEDQGGTLNFLDFSNCFNRCFQKTQTQLTFDDKHAGAGIGLYLVFELASHLHISVKPGVRTRFSLWLSQSNQFDPDSFSFNFFEG